MCTTGINYTGGNLPQVSMTPVANNGNTIRLLTSELEEKNLSVCWLYYSQVLKKFKNILIEDFLICHQCRWHRWCTLSCEYLREFSKRFDGILWGGGELFHEKIWSRKSRDTVPLRICAQELSSKCQPGAHMQVLTVYKSLPGGTGTKIMQQIISRVSNIGKLRMS